MVADLVPVCSNHWAGPPWTGHRFLTGDRPQTGIPTQDLVAAINSSSNSASSGNEKVIYFLPGFGHKQVKSHVPADRTGLFYKATLQMDPQPHGRMTLLITLIHKL